MLKESLSYFVSSCFQRVLAGQAVLIDNKSKLTEIDPQRPTAHIQQWMIYPLALMVLRTARKGVNAGNQFYGCSRFPDCKGTRAYE